MDQFHVVNNHDNEEDKHSKASTSTTIESILEPAGCSFVQSHRETCRIRIRQQIGAVTIGRREVGILGILRGLTIRDFSEIRTNFCCREITLPDNRRGVWTEHPIIQHGQMRTVCQHITLRSLISFHHANVRGSSSRICVPKTFCYPRVMSRSLPHLTLTTSTSSLSPTSPILQSSSSTHPSLLSHDPNVHCDDSRRSCGSSDLQSHTGIELLRSWWSISLTAGILHFKPPVFWKEEIWKVKVVERKPFNTTGVKKPLNWFFARLFLSISRVSTEQSHICATN